MTSLLICRREVVLPLSRGFVVLLALVPAMQAGEVKVFPVKGQDISLHRTYQWAPPRVVTKQGILENDPDVAPLIKTSVNKQLARKGYIEVSEGGDLLVLSAGVGVTTSQLQGFLLTWGFDLYWGSHVTTASPVSRVNKEGTLLINLVDAKTKKGVWSGYATQALGRPSTLPSSIDKAASRLFKKLPASGE